MHTLKPEGTWWRLARKGQSGWNGEVGECSLDCSWKVGLGVNSHMVLHVKVFSQQWILIMDMTQHYLHFQVLKSKMLIQKDICILMSIETLFTIARIWKQHKCPSIDNYKEEAVYICMFVCVYTPTSSHTYTMGYYLAIKKNEILPFVKHGWI